ncbi:beta 1-4 rhamnosyltransferase Cps2T [Oenococcus oeni]|uniref:Glycosyltransferase n=1 Tax=Oenococcus oeni (strain ATCC BAA-331 / PSU-1) TaxID=203123 RepID=Q04DW0_OENOB|nr:glycosyltransferase family 1 protein [Oenococcus oeni]ABJ57362.1 Glycosyltransferase [Oenococcus oeni PSU-1]EJO03386.1 glycosyltransferase [Oenococcus oeni AWRIB418]QGR01904.1 glycosyltransferase family 1 protein [Oenococcus oeni]TEU24504.1 glycosyltransferase family 1 protein [Oenococcus oeni]TEU56825.1 glycosyltransferase family 1 protein [Oenococcus oeni]
MADNKIIQHVYIVGSKGIPANYGGFETFVEKLTAGQENRQIKYHVASRFDNSEQAGKKQRFEYNGADVFSIDVPNIGSAQAIVYDYKALKEAIRISKQNQDKHPIFYVLANRIGPFAKHFAKEIHALGGRFYLNPDGHEWARAKWPKPVRKYWKYSEKKMVAAADLIIADNPEIEKYIKKEYSSFHPQTTYIAYGTDVQRSKLTMKDQKVRDWFKQKRITENNYFLVVGRFVPENNYETMIREFMTSRTKKDFVLVTNVEKNRFYERLKQRTHFDQDPRIKFVGTVYDQELLKYIRENAFAYFHGHEVGGTNPSLLEALSMTRLNMLIDVPFNRAVAKEGAMYWNKAIGNLTAQINQTETYDKKRIIDYTQAARKRVTDEFTWESIIAKYEELFVS